MDKAASIKCLYSQRDKFILIGLTGRTGSGCTTVANIMSKDSLQELDLRSYKTCDYNDSDERKYSVIYRYMKEGKKWKKFDVIEASSIIMSFILQDTYGRLFSYVDMIAKKVEIKEIQQLKKRIASVFLGQKLEDNFDIESIKNDVIDKELSEWVSKVCENDKYIESLEKRQLPDLQKMIEYFTNDLVNKKNSFSMAIKNITVEEVSEKEDEDKKIYNLYSYFMQQVGNNIRSSSEYDDNQEKPGKEITIAERINCIVKMINRREELTHAGEERTRICIDALRNSFEIQYFRDRYRAFYTFAINTENEYRQNRLGLNRKELESLDRIEYPGKDGIFYHQNVSACLEISDVYLYNPNIQNHKYFELTEQIVKYIALVLQPGLVAPTHLERCMQLAFNAKYNSGCLSRQVGAVVTGEDFSVRSVGWNDVPKGQVPCNLRCVEDYCRNKDSETFSEFELEDEFFDETMRSIYGCLQSNDIKIKKEGKCYSYCFKDIYNGITGKSNQVHTRALHAEENAFLQISKYGGAKIQGGKLFTTASPCELCSKKAYQLGIEEIYYIDPYPGISKSHILSFGKKGNPKMIFFQGAIGNAYISLYAPRMPYKDEIALVTGIYAKDEAEKIRKKHQQ